LYKRCHGCKKADSFTFAVFAKQLKHFAIFRLHGKNFIFNAPFNHEVLNMKTNIIVTSDFLCPWCYIGESRLFKAIQDLGDQVETEIEWRPYELNPDMPTEGKDRKEYRSGKYGWERSKLMDAQVVAVGSLDGLAFDYSKITRAPNTRLAHRLTKLAKQNGRANDYVNKVFQAYFEDGQDIGDKAILLAIIEQIGIDKKLAEAYLNSDEGLQELIDVEKEAQFRGVHSVPQFEIGNLIITGAQPEAVFHDALVAATGPSAQTPATGLSCDVNTGLCSE
jgi:predicted DsbA family dithiol-disulfide isomerase